jgi:hypothetical protein
LTKLSAIPTPKLSKKIRVVVKPQKTANFPEKRLRFYEKYAALVQQTLKKPLFQRFLHWILKREAIEKHQVKDIQVRVLPFLKDNGNTLAGRCGRNGEIILYPKRLDSCRKLTSKFGKKSAFLYIKSRARATLVHELLHLKYSSNEDEVRRLTEKYLRAFTCGVKNAQNPQLRNVLKVLFPS